MKINNILVIIASALLLLSCGNRQQQAKETTTTVLAAPTFSGDSALVCIYEQCAFGARVPGSEAHRLCGDYIISKFRQYGLTTCEQTAELRAWNGDRLPMRNIVASMNPDAEMRLLISAHWDSRPWADNDPDPKNHHTPVIGANDGASGVAVMIELARILSQAETGCGLERGEWGIDFVCFDCEDYGIAQWADDDEKSDDTWALGSQVWASHPHKTDYRALWGINLDMVGGRDACFMREGISMHFARNIVDRAWNMASQLGLSQYFPQKDGGYVTDDHLPINQRLGIPVIDIVPHYADCEQSSFGPTWHTVNDTPEMIDINTLTAVGTLMTHLCCNPL